MRGRYYGYLWLQICFICRLVESAVLSYPYPMFWPFFANQFVNVLCSEVALYL